MYGKINLQIEKIPYRSKKPVGVERIKMIKIGDIRDSIGFSCNISKMLLVKDLSLKCSIYPELHKSCYVVLGFQKGKGWWTLYNGTLADARKWMSNYTV